MDTFICDRCNHEHPLNESNNDPRRGDRGGEVCCECYCILDDEVKMQKRIKEVRALLPPIEDLHRAYCKASKRRYNAAHLMKHFSGNCYAVAVTLQRMLKENGIKIRDTYGHYHGWDERSESRATQQHGWLVYDEVIIVDPTRLVFDQKLETGIWVAEKEENERDYDEGGHALNEHIRVNALGHARVAPERKPEDKMFPLKIAKKHKAAVLKRLKKLLGNRDLNKGLTPAEAQFLGRFRPDEVGSYDEAHALYKAMAFCLVGFIPLDFRRKAEALAK